MFGVKFIKSQPTTYLIQYKDGKAVRQGAGISFFYYAPTTSLVAVPVASSDAPFIFNELTSGFQEITIQGQVTYRITDPQRVAQLLNFSPEGFRQAYVSDDPQKLPQRVVNVSKVLTQKELQSLTLRQALRAADALVQKIGAGLRASAEINALGLEILGLSILAIRPNPETARALEAAAREQLLGEADEAIYARRNAAVEQERAIRENELNTEIAVENKKRQIREAQVDAERAVQEKQHQLRVAELDSRIALEDKNKTFVALSAENARTEADAKAYGVAASMRAVEGVDARVLQALASVGMRPEQLIALSFQTIAERADKIGQLNVSPDLLRELLDRKSDG
ncbi:MAG TPA: SPFH domain-containing protein [Pyrinomonadaceae bacterium]|jgi:hypothetical protein